MKKISFKKKTRGLTLIELVMTIAIVGILASVSSMYIVEVVKLWDFMSFNNEVVSAGRMSLSRMAREIRQVYNQTSILQATNTRFNFNTNATSSVDYYLSSSNLMRNSDSLVTGVNNLSFVYYNKTNQQISSPVVWPDATDIYLINITLDLQAGSQRKILKTYVFPRNLGG